MVSNPTWHGNLLDVLKSYCLSDWPLLSQIVLLLKGLFKILWSWLSRGKKQEHFWQDPGQSHFQNTTWPCISPEHLRLYAAADCLPRIPLSFLNMGTCLVSSWPNYMTRVCAACVKTDTCLPLRPAEPVPLSHVPWPSFTHSHELKGESSSAFMTCSVHMPPLAIQAESVIDGYLVEHCMKVVLFSWYTQLGLRIIF